ncbi:hypothetical protein EC968_007280 [Mortierella alpina]|nr:hypothetical protein EC968_007280 [Mortierella alpina]
MPSSLRKRRVKQESEPPSASPSSQRESKSPESQGSQESQGHLHGPDQDQDRDQDRDKEEALFAGMQLEDWNWNWNGSDRRTASVSPTKRPRLAYEPAHYVDFDPGSPSAWLSRSPSQSPDLTQTQTQSNSHSPHPSASPTRALVPVKSEHDGGHSAFKAFSAYEVDPNTLSEDDSSGDDDQENNGAASGQDTDTSTDDQESTDGASDQESDSTVDDDDTRSEGRAKSQEGDGFAGDPNFESELEVGQDTHGSDQKKQKEREEQEHGGTDADEESDDGFWDKVGEGTKYRQEMQAKLEDLILRQTYISTVAPNRKEIQNMPMPLYLRGRSYPKLVNRTMEEEMRARRLAERYEFGKRRREKRLARLERHRNRGETQDQSIRYSSQCTSCIVQGLDCSGHRPICSQCHQSSSATTASLSSRTAVPSSLRVLPSDAPPGFCSYPVEGDLIIAPDMYKRLKETIPQAAVSTLNEIGLTRFEIADAIPGLTGRRDDSTDAGWVVGITKKHATVYTCRPMLDKNPAANADYMLDIKFRRGTNDSDTKRRRKPKGTRRQRQRARASWNINPEPPALERSTEMSTDAPRPRKRSRLASTLNRNFLGLPRRGSRSGSRKEIQQKSYEWVVNEANQIKGNKRRKDDVSSEDGGDEIDLDSARGAGRHRRDTRRYNRERQNQELFRDLKPQALMGDAAVYRLAEQLDDDHTVYLGLDKTAQDALFVNRQRENMNAMTAYLRHTTAVSIRELGWAGSEKREGRKRGLAVFPRVEVGMDGVKTYRRIKTFRARKQWREAAAKVRKVNSKTFRPWVPEKGEEILPSVCDVFEALDLPSHIALGMIIQEVVSDFAFKLGKESQLEDVEVAEERLNAERISGEAQTAVAGNGADVRTGGVSTGPEEEGEEAPEDEEEEEEEEEREEEEEVVVVEADGAGTGYRFSPRPTFAFDSSEEDEEDEE